MPSIRMRANKHGNSKTVSRGYMDIYGTLYSGTTFAEERVAVVGGSHSGGK